MSFENGMNSMVKVEAGKSHHLALGNDITGSDNNLFFREKKGEKMLELRLIYLFILFGRVKREDHLRKCVVIL